MGMLDTLFGGGAEGGYGDLSGRIQDAIDQIKQNMSPYMNAGTDSLNNLQNFFKQYSNPQDFYDKTMANWTMTPAAKMQEQYGTKAMNQAAAAGGTVGTPAQQEALARFDQNLVSGDQQNYLSNIMGIGGQYTSGEGNIMNTGYNAAMNSGNTIADLLRDLGSSQMQGDMAHANAFNNFLGTGMDVASMFF